MTPESNESTDVRAGGADVWSPSAMPPIGPDLTDEQTLACAFRILADIGFAENMAGHITWQRPDDDVMMVNPWGLWWSELTASDICTVDFEANVVSGRWDVTPAIHIHTELHRLRPDARVVIHNHPYYVTLLAALGILPEYLHQTSSMYLEDMVLVREYDGEIDEPRRGGKLAEEVGKAKIAILGNHGVIVTGATPAEAIYRCSALERVCRLTYDVMLTGREALEMPYASMVGMKKSLMERASDVYWAGAVRSLIKRAPEVLL